MHAKDWRTLLVGGLVLVVAGCGGAEPAGGADAEDPSGGDGATDGDAGSDDGNDTDAMIPPDDNRTVSLVASHVNGTAPLIVVFTLNATGADGETNWTIKFGDGESNESVGEDFPISIDHTYGIAGNFTAKFLVHWADKLTLTDSINITVLQGTGGELQLVFEYDEQIVGCAPDFGPECSSYDNGPGEDAVDGHWVPLDDRYWGLSFTSSASQAGQAVSDTDCYFVDEKDGSFEKIGSANNGSGPCEGTVPASTDWIFYYPYGAAADYMSVTFTA